MGITATSKHVWCALACLLLKAHSDRLKAGTLLAIVLAGDPLGKGERDDRTTDSRGGRESCASLRAVRLASLAGTSVDVVPVPARPGGDPGGWWSNKRMLSSSKPHGARRCGELA